MTFISDRRAARRTTPGGTVYTTWVSPKRRRGSAEHTDWRFACTRVRIAPNSRRPARTCFSELETSKGGSDIIDCLRRSHRAVLSLEASCSNEPTPDRPRIQVGSPYREPGRPSQATKKSRKLASAATLQTQVDTSSRWLPKEDNGASRLSGRVRWRWDD
jgi:hypothetical protein